MSSEETSTRPTGPGGLWWAVVMLCLLGLGVVTWLLLTREPMTKVVEVPSTEVAVLPAETIAELVRLDEEAAILTRRTTDILNLVVAYECPPGSEPKDPARLAMLRQQATKLLQTRRQN